MTAIAVPAASARPVPWPRLAWVVWRRYRTMLIATVGVLAVISVYLVVTGEQMRSSYNATTACRPVGSTACMYKFNTFHDSYASPGLIGVVLMFLPAIIGSFVGAPLLSRELETGTFRYTFTGRPLRDNLRGVVALVVAPDGSWLASAGSSTTELDH